jgi:hypothetical protein
MADNPGIASFRRTKGIVSDIETSDPRMEADVIVTAATVGFAASHIQDGRPIEFDRDPLDAAGTKTAAFEAAVTSIDQAIADYLKQHDLAPSGQVGAGLSPGYTKGAVIVGVYELAGQSAPPSVSAPVLSAKGRALYERITNDSTVVQYRGRGAYTGFVDNHNETGNTDPIGPRATARFLAPTPELAPDLHPRWLPADGSPVWSPRRRKDTADSFVPWGLIMGDAAGEPSTSSVATNLADQTTIEMRESGMVFNGEPTIADIANYTHGMIQAIYKAYVLGPSCTPYEIAVGDQTKKMASCLPCTLFMVAAGYPPTSTHLGRGESWAPLYEPYNPGESVEPHEHAVIRDLNGAWHDACREFLTLGLQILDDGHVSDDHRASRDAVRDYLAAGGSNGTVASTLLLDALSIHDAEAERIRRTLSP